MDYNFGVKQMLLSERGDSSKAKTCRTQQEVDSKTSIEG